MRVDQQRWLEAEVERLGPLGAIVKDLAATDPVSDIDPEYGHWVCMVCPEDEVGDDIYLESADVVHHEDCPWVRAKAWVEANPE